MEIILIVRIKDKQLIIQVYDEISRHNAKNYWCCYVGASDFGECFQEVIYQRALEIEMHNMGLNYQGEFEMDIFYKKDRIGGRRVDFFVENCIMVELKALIKMEDVHLAQAMNYLEAYNVEIGLMINFGGKSLEFKRVYNSGLKVE